MISRIGNRGLLRNRGFTPFEIRRRRRLFCFGRGFVTGFTFIELVLVTIIILILAGLSTPIFRNPFQNIQLKNTCQELVQLMRYLQAKSIAERKICRLNFDFEKGIFWPTVQDSPHPGEFKRIKTKLGQMHQLAEGISMEGEVAFISFYPDGSADKANIKVFNNKGNAYTITTQRNIGYVKIEE